MISASISTNQMEKELVKEEALNWIKSDIDGIKFQPMIDELIEKNRKQGYLDPEILLESQIKEKIAQGETKEQAIEELHAKIKRKRARYVE